MRKVFLVLSLFSSLLIASVEESGRRVDAHLIIGDVGLAVKESESLVQSYPEAELAQILHIKALSKTGDAHKMMGAWQAFAKQFPDKAYQREIVETICLGILQKGCESESLLPRLIALLAIARTELPEAVSWIKKGCLDSNANIRTLAIKLAAAYKDRPLQEIIIHRFALEKSPEAREAILAAIAELKLEEMLPQLHRVLENSSEKTLEEKRALVRTISQLEKRATRKLLERLYNTRRVGDALLACELIVTGQRVEAEDLLQKLVRHHCPEVSVAALKSLGILRLGGPFLDSIVCDRDPVVGISASWVAGLCDSSTIVKNFSYWLSQESSQTRALAIAALGTLSQEGKALLKLWQLQEKEPWVRVNLAIQLLRQREQIEIQGNEIFTFLHETKEKLMWEEIGFFKIVQKSTHVHKPLISNYPEAVNQALRLELLNLLALVEYEKAEAAIREFLKDTRWELLGLAAESLLQEGDSSAIDIIKKLLYEKDKETRWKAAIALAAWGRDPEAIEILIALYPEGDRTIKIKVLEALGMVGEESTLPFLMEALKEPSETLRLVAASSLIRLLYH